MFLTLDCTFPAKDILGYVLVVNAGSKKNEWIFHFDFELVAYQIS